MFFWKIAKAQSFFNIIFFKVQKNQRFLARIILFTIFDIYPEDGRYYTILFKAFVLRTEKGFSIINL
ncbi:hypothetical protein JOE44_000014 [Chryseobacterium sp. PvR013]|nr:hypothetical protein [Chryseobacterium sp. PvR013]